MFRYRRQMRKFFGVFGDLFLFNSRFDAGKHFYDNAVTRPGGRFECIGGATCREHFPTRDSARFGTI